MGLYGDNTFFPSQSGKLVTKMFQKIQQLIDDKETLVFVLVDEVIYDSCPDCHSHSNYDPVIRCVFCIVDEVVFKDIDLQA